MRSIDKFLITLVLFAIGTITTVLITTAYTRKVESICVENTLFQACGSDGKTWCPVVNGLAFQTCYTNEDMRRVSK